MADFFDTIEPPFKGYLLFICVLMLLLSFFMMTVSFSQKMRDLEWEPGVLRAIGLSKAQSKKVFLYEAFCVVATSLVTGIGVGLLGTLLFSIMMQTMTSLPLMITIAWTHITTILVMISISTFYAVKIPAEKLN